jgi:hypothetical protein
MVDLELKPHLSHHSGFQVPVSVISEYVSSFPYASLSWHEDDSYN